MRPPGRTCAPECALRRAKSTVVQTSGSRVRRVPGSAPPPRAALRIADCPEHNGVFRCELSVLVEGAQVRDREIVTPGGGVGDRPGSASHEQTWILREYGGQLPNRKLGLGARRRHAAVQAWQYADALLWVALRRTG